MILTPKMKQYDLTTYSGHPDAQRLGLFNRDRFLLLPLYRSSSGWAAGYIPQLHVRPVLLGPFHQHWQAIPGSVA